MERNSFIGGSDAGAILGVNPWKSPLKLWAEKTGLIEPDDLSQNEAVQFGIAFENAVCAYTKQKFGVQICVYPHEVHPDFEYIQGHLDGVSIDPPFIAEIKTAGEYTKGFGEEGTDQIPETYQAQAHHYLNLCPEYPEVRFFVLHGRKLKQYVVKRDEEIGKILLKKEIAFWTHNVINRIPPPAQTESDLDILFPSAIEKSVEISQKIKENLLRYRDLKTEGKLLEKKIETYELEIKKFMGENSLLVDSEGKKLCSWANRETERLDQKVLKEKHPEIYQECLKKSSSRFFLGGKNE